MDGSTTASVPRGSIESTVERWLDDSNCPGASVAITDGGETVLAEGFGHRQLDPERPATAGTLIGIGSATKPVTATAVLTLVDRGKLRLDDAVPDHVPYFETAPGEPITVHELLSHTSGMPADDVATLTILGAFDADDGPSIDDEEAFREHVAGAADRRLVDGDRFLYYNAGYGVLARVVEAVTGRPFARFVERAVFDPLGMETATFDVAALEGASDVMTPYRRDEDGDFRPATLPEGPGFEAPGGLLASATDLARLLAGHVKGWAGLDDALRERMYEPVGTYERLVDGTEIGYGYGFQCRPFGADTLVGHDGTTGVSAGYVGFLRDRGLGVAVGCNAQPEASPESLAVELLGAITDRDPATVLPERAVDRSVDAVTGRYESYRGVRSATVTWNGDRLVVDHETPMDAERYRLAPASLDPDDHEFVTIEDDGERFTAEFFVDDDGVELLLGPALFRRVGPVDADAPPVQTAE